MLWLVVYTLNNFRRIMYQNSRFLGVSHLSLMVLRWVTFLFKDQESLMSICLKIKYDSFLSDVLSVAEVG